MPISKRPEAGHSRQSLKEAALSMSLNETVDGCAAPPFITSASTFNDHVEKEAEPITAKPNSM